MHLSETLTYAGFVIKASAVFSNLSQIFGFSLTSGLGSIQLLAMGVERISHGLR
jgi:hypothetical protein